jgi:hypothetical protein
LREGGTGWKAAGNGKSEGAVDRFCKSKPSGTKTAGIEAPDNAGVDSDEDFLENGFGSGYAGGTVGVLDVDVGTDEVENCGGSNTDHLG